MGNDIDLLRFRFDVAQNDVQKAKQSVKGVQIEVDKFNRVLERLERLYVANLKSQLASARANTNVATSASSAARAAEKQAAATRDVGSAASKSASEVDRLAASQASFLARQDEFQGFRQEGRFQSFALRNLGSVLPGGGGEAFQQFSGAFELLDTLPKLDLSFQVLKESLAANASSAVGFATAIGPVGLALGATVGVLAVAFGDAVTQLQNDAKLLREIIDTTLDVRVGIATGDVTRDTAQETFEKNQQRIAVLQDELNNLRREEAQTFEDNVEKYKNAAFGLDFVGDAAARANTFLETGGQANSLYGESVDRLTTDINTLQAENFELGKALIGTGTAFKEVAEAADETTSAAEAAAAAAKAKAEADRELARIAQEQIATDNKLIEIRQLAITADRLSADQLTDRIARNREQIELNSELVRSGAVGIDTQKRLQAETQQLIESQRVLTAALPTAQARAAAERLRGVAKELAAIGKQTGAENTRFRGALDAIAGGLREKLADLAGDRDNAIGKAQSEAFSARAEAVRQNGRQLAELEAKTAKDRQRIIRIANASIANAIQDRDAVALLAANAARREQLQTLKDNYNDQRDRINDALSETNRAIAMKLQEQTNAARAQYNEQTNAARVAAAQQRQAEVQKNQQILAELRSAAQQAVAVERQKNQSIISSAMQAATQISSVFSGIAQRVAASAAASSRMSATSSYGRVGGSIGPAPRPAASASMAGGFLASSLTRPQTSSGGVNINIANAGVTRKMVETTVGNAYDQFLRGFKR